MVLFDEAASEVVEFNRDEAKDALSGGARCVESRCNRFSTSVESLSMSLSVTSQSIATILGLQRSAAVGT